MTTHAEQRLIRHSPEQLFDLVADPDELRAEEEKQFWAQRDPIKALERDLVSAGLATADDLRTIEKEIDAEVQDSVDFALSAPEPDGSELTRYIWAED